VHAVIERSRDSMSQSLVHFHLIMSQMKLRLVSLRQ